MKELKSHRTFSGKTQFWSHLSKETKTEMKFSTFIPGDKPRGCIIWLSGLTCTEENFITKAGAQRFLDAANLMVIAPDTSPRGLNLPGEHDSYDFGSGAGFYVDAITDGYKDHYRMYSYILNELYPMIQNDFGVQNISIMGHSMGGHGAMVLGLRNPDKFKSISAFSPIVNPMECAWGKKAFTGYLGTDKELWKFYDSCELLKMGMTHPYSILISQGTHDEFLPNQLLTERFVTEAQAAGQEEEVRYADEFDHSYYFISTFMQEHILHHKKALSN